MTGDGNALIGGRYLLVRRLGRGGMAEVWLATDQRLNGKQVAVKRLLGFSAGGPDSEIDVERARREAYAASRLNHPNLVAVTDFVAEGGEPFIVMEYVEGSTLDELIEPPGLDPSRAARLVGQVAAALVEAHEAGIVHRDIKPANIMVTRRDVAKLADFGIARTAGDARLTQTGFFTGTIAYLAPEVLEGHDSSSASDVWALGAVLFEAVEGRPAFEGRTTAALIAAIALQEPPRSTRSRDLGPIVAGMLRRNPAARSPIETVAEQLAALGAVRRPDTSASRPTVSVNPADEPSRLPPHTPPPSGPPLPQATPQRAAPPPPRTPPAGPPAGVHAPLPPAPVAPPARSHRARWAWVAGVAAVLIALGIGIPVLLSSGGDSHGTTAGGGSRTATSGGGTSSSSSSLSSSSSSSPSSPSSSPPALAPSTFTVLAHQGGDEHYAEETLPAFEAAAKAGYAVETDVRWTSDGVAVISHDDETGAQFSCSGGPLMISRTKAADLHSQCHSKASDSRDGGIYAIPTFDQTVRTVRDVTGATLFAEIKIEQTPAEVASFLSTLTKYRMTARTVVTSFLPGELAKMRAQARGKGVSLRLMRFFGPGTGTAPVATVSRAGLWAVAVDSRIATKPYLDELAQRGLVTIVFTVNTKAQWATARDQGADYVLTDTPGAYSTWLGSQ